MDDVVMRRLVSSARVGHLATVSSEGAPHVVPVCFSLVGDAAYSWVDDKPKRSRRLRRIANIQATGRVCLLVDQYDDDWSQLWWVRLDGHGRLVDDSAEAAMAHTALSGKYPQYALQPPDGPVLAVDVAQLSGWTAERPPPSGPHA